MFKKILLTTALTALTSSATYALSFPYLGAGTGVIVNTTNSSNFRGMPFSGFIGYGGLINETFYLAGELGATAGTVELTSDTTLSNFLRTTYGFNLSFLPGVMLTDHTIAYLRIGVVNTNFSQYAAISTTTNGKENVKYVNEHLTGGQFGFGLQTAVTQNVDVRGEYDYVAYTHSIRSDQFNLAFVYKFD